MSAIAIVSSFVVSCLGILTNCSIIVLVILTKQLNSPNRILLLHHSIICFALSAVYLWLLINNSIMLSIVSSASSATFDLVAASSLTTTVSNIASSSTASITSTDMSEALTTQSIDTIYDPFCSINDVFIHLLQPLSLWTISCINFDRYYAICSPLHYNTLFTTRKVTIFLCCGWIIILLTILPIYVMLMMFDDRLVMSVCWFRSIDIQEELGRSSENSEYYWFEVQILLTTLLTIFLPMSLIIACNVKILTIANYQRHRIASAIYESVLSAQVAITHQKNPFPPLCANLLGQPFPIAASIYPPKPNPFELRRKSQKAAIVVFELIASVVLLYSPYYLFVIVYAFYRKSRHLSGVDESNIVNSSTEYVVNILIALVQFFLLCSPTVNAILYGFKDKTIQESVHNFWRKQKTKIELHYEIQARTPSTCGSRRGSMTEITNNFPPNQPQLKRQLSEFFFGTSSSLTSQLNGEPNRMYRTPSDSLFTRNERRRSSHHEYLSPNFDPLGKMNSSTMTTTATNNNINTCSLSSASTSPPSMIRQGLATSQQNSKNILTNFKKLIVGSKSDFTISSNCGGVGIANNSVGCSRSDSITKEKSHHFPQILITKFSDSLLNTQSQSTSRRDSDIQQVEIGIELSREERVEEQEPLLTTQTQSLDDFLHEQPLRVKIKTMGSMKFQTL